MTGIDEQTDSLKSARSAAAGSGTTRTARSARREKPLTPERLRKSVFYCKKRGGLFRIAFIKGHNPGTRVGYINKMGYRAAKIGNVLYLEHRLVWFYHHGAFPSGALDHINGFKDDNRIENLRLADEFQNTWNRKGNRNGKSGYKGVTWNKADKIWRAKTKFRGQYVLLGSFKTPEEAARAYDRFALANHGEFARLNFDRLEYL